MSLTAKDTNKINRKLPGYDPVRANTVKKTAAKFGISHSYVRMIIDNPTTSRDDVRRYYQSEYEVLKAVMS